MAWCTHSWLRIVPIDGTPCGAGHRVVHVACGGAHSLVVTATGAVFGWGLNGQGQLGVGAGPPFCCGCAAVRNHSPTMARAPHCLRVACTHAGDCIHRAAPTGVTTLTNDGVVAVAAAAGFAHSVVLAADGSIFVFGWVGRSCSGLALRSYARRVGGGWYFPLPLARRWNAAGQLGVSGDQMITVPWLVEEGAVAVRSVACGDESTCTCLRPCCKHYVVCVAMAVPCLVRFLSVYCR